MSRRNGTKSAVYVAGDFSGEAEVGWPFSGGIGEALIWGVGRAFFFEGLVCCWGGWGRRAWLGDGLWMAEMPNALFYGVWRMFC